MKKLLITAFRHLWKHKLFTTLNIFGLAVSICACWIIFRIADYEFSYDRGLPGKENIYRVISQFGSDEKKSFVGGIAAPLYQEVREQVNGLEYVVPVFTKWINQVKIDNQSDKLFSFDVSYDFVATNSSYFKMLPYHWLAGNKSTALIEPESVVLTESRAIQYFPAKKPQDIIGQTITYYSSRDTLQKTVTGIVADFKTPSEFTATDFFSLPKKTYELSDWTNTNGGDKLYLQLKPGTALSKILNQVNNLASIKVKEFFQKTKANFDFNRLFQLIPLSQTHFATYVEEYHVRKASKPVIYGLMSIALFLIILASINYINMSVASIPQRAKEIGVRKTFGCSRKELIGHFLTETLITALMAAILSLVMSIIGFSLLRDIIPPEIIPISNVLQLTGFIIILSIAITVLAGIYPAWLITKVKAVDIFRGASFNSKANRRFSLQKVLIVFQFVIALIFITSALFVGRQLRYVLTTDMGFDKGAVILVDLPWKYMRDEAYKNKLFVLATELKRIPGIKNVSLGANPMTDNLTSSRYEYLKDGKEPVQTQVIRKWVDTSYLSLYNLKLLAGRNIHASDTTKEFVINETAVKAFGFASPQDALGKIIGQKGSKFPIVGVVKDFHTQDFYQAINPIAFESDKSSLFSLNIKLAGTDPAQWQKTLKAIESEWYRFYPPETYSYKFYDEIVASMYEKDRHLDKLIDLATIISIFISCLGLFGLAALTVFQRTKEIGIRKVLGASVLEIIRLLSKDYMSLILIAFLIASPIVWWAMNVWLQNFVYRLEISWWIFPLAGMVAVLIAFATVSFQAIKAALANPVKSLRTE